MVPSLSTLSSIPKSSTESSATVPFYLFGQPPQLLIVLRHRPLTVASANVVVRFSQRFPGDLVCCIVSDFNNVVVLYVEMRLYFIRLSLQ